MGHPRVPGRAPFKINGSREVGSHPAEKHLEWGTRFGRPMRDGTVESHPSATNALGWGTLLCCRGWRGQKLSLGHPPHNDHRDLNFLFRLR